MLYYPDLCTPSESELTAKGLQFWPTGPIGYRGYISAGETTNIKGTIIVFHGNAWIIKGTGHNDWSMLIDMSKWQEIMDFLSDAD